MRPKEKSPISILQSLQSKLLLPLLLVVGMLLLAACSTKPDPDQPFVTALNGKRYQVTFQPARATVRLFEVGMGDLERYTIFFPQEGLAAGEGNGLEIVVEPESVVLGQEIAFGPGTDAGIYASFFPVSGHRMSEGTLLTFTPSGQSDAGGMIRFDTFEPVTGGRVQGELLHATLYGSYEDIDGVVSEPAEPMKLELWHFPFDATLEESPF